MRKIARFIISEELLVQALHLPQGTRIKGVQGGGDPKRNDYEFTITNDSLKNLTETAPVPLVEPEFETHYARCGHATSVRFVKWQRK